MKKHTFITFLTSSYVDNYMAMMGSYFKHHKERDDKFIVYYTTISENEHIVLCSLGIKCIELTEFNFNKSNQIKRLNNAFHKLDVILLQKKDFILIDADILFLNSFDFSLLDNDNIHVATDPEELFNSGFIKFCGDLSNIKRRILENKDFFTKYADQDILNHAIFDYELINIKNVRCWPLFAITKSVIEKTQILHYIGEDKKVDNLINKFNL